MDRYDISATDYQKARATRMTEYLNALREEAIRANDTDQIIDLAYDCLRKLCFALISNGKILEIPDCCPNNGSDGDFHVMFTWDKGEYYLECEVMVNGIAEFFYRNRLTNEVWGETHFITEDHFPDSVYDELLLDKLSYFVE